MGHAFAKSLHAFIEDEAQKENDKKYELLKVMLHEFSVRIESMTRTYDALVSFGCIELDEKQCYETLMSEALSIVVHPDLLGHKPGSRYHLVAAKLYALEKALSVKLCWVLR